MSKSNQQINNSVFLFIQSLRTEAFKEHCVSQYYKFTGLPSDGSKSINLGYIYLFENIKFLAFFMESWVSFIDEKLRTYEEGTDDYADILGLRGYTLPEYKLISLEIDVLKFFFSIKVPLYYPISSFKRGTYMVGQSGSGKSTLLKLLIYDLQRRSQKIRNRSIVLIEPSGDLSLEVVSFALNRREHWKRMVYLNPFLRQTAKEIFGYDLLGADYTFAINPFQTRKNITNQEINYLTEEIFDRRNRCRNISNCSQRANLSDGGCD